MRVLRSTLNRARSLLALRLSSPRLAPLVDAVTPSGHAILRPHPARPRQGGAVLAHVHGGARPPHASSVSCGRRASSPSPAPGLPRAPAHPDITPPRRRPAG